jgi:putative restriction endonuclease
MLASAPAFANPPPMPKAILTTKVVPSYDDLPEERYHFPRTYLGQVEAAVGDWVIYYEPRRTSVDLSSRGGRQAYFAAARVRSVVPDPSKDDHFYAMISDFLEFDKAVPFQEGGRYYESALERDDGKTNKGAFGRAVRGLGDLEFEAILQAGFAKVLDEVAPRKRSEPSGERAYLVAEDTAEYERPIVERVVARPFRDAAFAAAVKSAYNETCAMTGLRIINGGGRAEVQAAHIRPVAAGGSDSVRNGLALSGTVHWMFDRGLISVDEDHSILVAKDKMPDTALRLIREERRLILPERFDAHPHREVLRYHRDTIFKG